MTNSDETLIDPASLVRDDLSRRIVRAIVAIGLGGAALALLVVYALWVAGPDPGVDFRPSSGRYGLVALAVLGAVALIAGLVGRRLARSVNDPLAHIRRTAESVTHGEVDARVGLSSSDEIGRVSRAIDAMLDDRVSVLARVAKESEDLNNSVIDIMQAVGEIATTKDLSLRVPVTENVTGAISDALNLLTEETSRVLSNVSLVSQNVAHATVAVKSQSDLANHAAAREQREVELAARELAQAATALTAIAERARTCNESAERAVKATGEAMQSVSGTEQGIVQSRDLIRETEKRIKRLGERSQEIGQVVGIIQAIAERTGILALNASMHAAAAGEAGRSFAVVADEVKRLSESAREATSQIGRLVTAIQTETNDTVLAMNLAITKVVEISRLADDASREMRRTQNETETLATHVRDIARTSTEQAKVGAGLQERARIIQEASSETARQLSSQTVETRRLVEYAKALLDEVSVFKLPQDRLP
jgi:methyl-accepting chemotaxis protein